MAFVTTNVRFDSDSYKRLKLRAVEERKSLAKLIREAVEQVYGQSVRSKTREDFRKDVFFRVVGLCSTGIQDGAEHHDRDIYGASG